MLRGHFLSYNETVKHIFITKFGIYTANTAAIFVTLALKLKKIVTLLVFVQFL